MYPKQLLLFSSVIISIQSHLVPPDNAGIDQLKKWCEYAYECFHDKIYVCGRGPQQTRTFLDVCDMYEYSCESNQEVVEPAAVVVECTYGVHRAGKVRKVCTKNFETWVLHLAPSQCAHQMNDE